VAARLDHPGRIAIRERFLVAESTRRDVLGLVLSAVRRVVTAQRDRIHTPPGADLVGMATGEHGVNLDVRIRLDGEWLEVEIEPRGSGPARAAHLGTVPAGEAPDERFGEWLRRRLRDERLSQESAARRIGVSSRTVGRWVRGDTEPRYRDLARLREVLGDLPEP